jgi:hypothetical protein
MPRHPASAAIELSRVKFGGTPIVVNKEDEDWSSASETESDVTEPDEDASEPEYFPGKSISVLRRVEKVANERDAIKWARYRDSRKDRPDGCKGWVSQLLRTAETKC